MLITNKEVYRTREYEPWAYGQGLILEEKFLVERYLQHHKKTLEAGTGGGRILLEIKKMGFNNLFGYDYLPEFIQQAKKKDTSGSISFEVHDATDLNTYENNAFEQIIYLQQILSMMEDENSRLKAFEQAYRILDKGGTALFSFLCFEGKIQTSKLYTIYVAYLRFLRTILAKKVSIQSIPWVKNNEKIQFLSALLDKGPNVYWYRASEAEQLLKKVGFKVIAVGGNTQLQQGKMYDDFESLQNQPLSEMLYVVCTK
ncbi:conserved hypothetical protein [Rivularia sp. IAM M-261]|nr:conserved hypothetical protein [Calothrix sp. PCC 7716]GJD17389.1 conserved hypothetical protein [Rivularia sp. IAM M-261]